MISQVFNEDNLVTMDKYPDNYFDLAVVDPPYGINAPKMTMGSNPIREGRNDSTEGTAVRIRKGRLNSGGGKLKDRLLNSSVFEWDNEPPPAVYFKELFRVSKNQIIWGGNYFDLPPTRCIICWDKKQPWESFSQWEMAWTSFDKPAKMYRISNTGGGNKEKKIHPTQKPVQLYDNIFRDFATAGMKVYDSHLGSGSSRISADKAGLVFLASEISEAYYDDQEMRFYKYKQQLRIEFDKVI